MRTQVYNDGTGDGIRDIQAVPKQCNLLSVEAWNGPDGWQWNNWHKVARVPVALADKTPRALLHWLRSFGYLTSGSAGRLAVEDDGYNVVILARGTREPLYAIAYGEVQS